MSVALSLRHVRKVYRAGIPGCIAAVHALRDATLEVASGEVVALSGAPGAGKTTLLMIAAGRLRADGGAVSWFGSVAGPGLHPPGIACVPEYTSYYSCLTVREALEYYTMMRDVGISRSSAVFDTLNRVGLADLAQELVSRLSPFQIRRLALAQALLTSPRLLLLDETMSAGSFSHDLEQVIRDLASDGVAVLAAGRSVRGVERIASREVVLAAGRIGAPDRASRPEPLLELLVASPPVAAARLGARLDGVRQANGRVQVPLRGVSAESVMALCAALDVVVHGSEVVTSRIMRSPRERSTHVRVAEATT